MTIASKIGSILPKKVYTFIQPKYHLYEAKRKLIKRGGRYSFNYQYGGWILEIPMPKNGNMIVLVRTLREFRRAVKFGTNKEDLIWKWLNWLEPNKVLYDIGSANGLEGFSASHLNNINVCFVEPYTPSIETILKTISINKPGWFFDGNGNNNLKNVIIKKKSKETKNFFEVVHAACTSIEDYKRLSMHAIPIAGQTRNTYGKRQGYEEGGGRNRKNILLSQWIKGVTIDSLHYNYKMKLPNYIKIDVDGHETAVIEGAKKIIKSRKVLSWAIELNGKKRIKKITDTMTKNGYVIAGDFDHYPGYEPPTIDRIFLKKELLGSWQNFSF